MNIADFSLYAYTHVAAEGGFDLTDYPCGWCLADPGGQPAGPYSNEPRARRAHYLPMITHSHQTAKDIVSKLYDTTPRRCSFRYQWHGQQRSPVLSRKRRNRSAHE